VKKKEKKETSGKRNCGTNPFDFLYDFSFYLFVLAAPINYKELWKNLSYAESKEKDHLFITM